MSDFQLLKKDYATWGNLSSKRPFLARLLWVHFTEIMMNILYSRESHGAALWPTYELNGDQTTKQRCT